jgi:hypothetical protein
VRAASLGTYQDDPDTIRDRYRQGHRPTRHGRRWPGVSGGLCFEKAARRTPGHAQSLPDQRSSTRDAARVYPHGLLVLALSQPTASGALRRASGLTELTFCIGNGYCPSAHPLGCVTHGWPGSGRIARYPRGSDARAATEEFRATT